MVRLPLAPLWPILAPFHGMDHQKSNFSLISGTLSVGGCWGQLMLLFFENSCGTQKFPISVFQNHLQSKSNLHIFICQSQFIKSISKWDTLYLCTEKSVNWLHLSFFCSLYVFRLWNGCLIAAHFRTGRPSAGLRGLFSTMARITEFCRNIMRHFWQINQQKYYSWCIKNFPNTI